MSDISKNSTDLPQEVATGTLEIRAKIDKALQNPDLLRIVGLLIDNEDDLDFLCEVRKSIEKELNDKEIGKLLQERTELVKKEARRKFWGTLKANGVYKKKCRIRAWRDFPPGTHETEIYAAQYEDRLKSDTIPLTDDMLRILDEGGIEIFRSTETKDDDAADMVFMLKKPDGSLVEMEVFGNIEEHYEFDLREVVVR